ncbi:MAG: ribbon-helix-helix protein, CopG family [Pseudonocardia sp.]
MQRTNIFLDDRQLDLLRRLGAQRGTPVAGLVREAIDEWLERNRVRAVNEDEWQQRFDSLLARRAAVSQSVDEAQVTADVADAVAEVRSERVRARRR